MILRQNWPKIHLDVHKQYIDESLVMHNETCFLVDFQTQRNLNHNNTIFSFQFVEIFMFGFVQCNKMARVTDLIFDKTKNEKSNCSFQTNIHKDRRTFRVGFIIAIISFPRNPC